MENTGQKKQILGGCGINMGLFDSMITNNEFCCSECNHKFKDIDGGIQTKKFGSLLISYSTGDVVEDVNDETTTVKCYTYCPDCMSVVDVFFSMHKGIYLETFGTQEEAELESAQFNLLTEYKKLNKDRNQLNDKLYEIKSNIKDVIRVFSGEEKFNSYVKGFIIRKEDIFDYNIITTLKNILKALDRN